MAYIDGPVLSTFQNLVNGTHDFDEKEMKSLRKAAEEVKAVIESANERQQQPLAASASGVISEGMPVGMHGRVARSGSLETFLGCPVLGL
jgi:hypothetical protein